MNQLRRILLLALGSLALLSGVAHADPLCPRPLRLAYSMLPPLYYQDEQGEGRGIEVDLAQALSHRTGCTFLPTYESRIRLWAAFDASQVDISLSGVATAERERFAVFLPYLHLRNVLLLRNAARSPAPASPNPMNDPETTLAVTRGFHYGPFWEPWISQVQSRGLVSQVAEEGDAVRLVAIGRADTTIVREIAWSYYASQYSDRPLRKLDVGATAGVMSVVLSRKTLDPAVHKAIAKALSEMKADGSLLRILQKHLPAELADKVIDGGQ
ncbi:transporter substrate-binding domain-containing protein [Niveibacterium sp. 24ML]|uniref:substrate-binding periplasmic protein n=1 Tax=Niveibacterium sp. 24ML TaxID=2985512 RepID=UPI00226D4F7B|nr:transporter substrate-binding domain-containing protein [Niveibacterium sp. 24ML]MCX9157833.1 transporter substrate-binding domain-containing protein [Niveibacterium sp. 24ML]